MFQHEPYGIDDPYKSAEFERFPRDPQPGDSVQVRFRTRGPGEGPAEAWVTVAHGGASRKVAATPLGGGAWSADIGSFEGGVVEYNLGAPGAGSCSYRFDVGRWVEVSGVCGVEELPDRLRLRLRTTSAREARLELAFPTHGAVRLELAPEAPKAAGGADPRPPGATHAPHAGERAPFTHEHRGDVLHVEAPGLTLEIDLAALTLTARAPGRPEAAFSGSLRFDWLELADGQARQARARFGTQPSEWLYGLGERFTHPNRKGQEWDVRVYEEYKQQGKRTYLPVPFVVSNAGYGVWLDAEEPSYFDLTGSTALVSLDRFVEPGAAAEQATGPLLSLCVLVGERPYDVTAAFTRLTGAIAVPPKWAFAPWMSSNSWNSQATAEAALQRTVAEEVPAGVIVIEAWSDESTFYIFNDAEYTPMEGGHAPRLSDFTFKGRWPDPKAFVDACHEHGIRVVLWQIPVQKHLTEPHPQHDLDERYMIEQGYGIMNADGTPYRSVGWWFTHGLVLDFTNPAARDWWFSKRRYLFDDLGIDGMKTDGGEHLWGRDLRAHDGRRGLQLFNSYPNFYVGAYNEFVQEATGNDGVTFSRAGYTGAQRFPGHWAGDEDSTWDAYRASIRAGLAAGVAGVSMWSWDLAGFSGEIPTVELYLRSTAMAVFSPLMQYHSEGHGATEVRDRTPWNIAERQKDPSALTEYRRWARLRMRILDLVHEDATELSRQGLPLMRYPALEHPERHEFLSRDEFAYLFGRDLLVAPVVDKGVGAREVRLPPGEWVDGWSGARFQGPRALQATATLEYIPVFVRADSPRLQRWLAALADPDEGS